MPDKKKFELSPSISIIAAGVIIAAAIIYTNLHPGAAAVAANVNTAPTANANVSAPSAQDHIIGSPNASLVLIEYSDFQCPFCSIVYPTLKKIVDDSNGKIAWVMRNFPLTSLHPNANPAANAAECIAEQLGNDGWWKFADDIFANQDKMSTAFYASLAQKYGADMAKYNSCFSSSKYRSKIDAQAVEAQSNGGQGTPYTVLYDAKGQAGISGALPADSTATVAGFNDVIKAFQARQ